MPSDHERLSADQTEEENRKAFVARLVAAGWSREKAEREYDGIQEEDPLDWEGQL